MCKLSLNSFDLFKKSKTHKTDKLWSIGLLFTVPSLYTTTVAPQLRPPLPPPSRTQGSKLSWPTPSTSPTHYQPSQYARWGLRASHRGSRPWAPQVLEGQAQPPFRATSSTITRTMSRYGHFFLNLWQCPWNPSILDIWNNENKCFLTNTQSRFRLVFLDDVLSPAHHPWWCPGISAVLGAMCEASLKGPRRVLCKIKMPFNWRILLSSFEPTLVKWPYHDGSLWAASQG